MDIEKAVETLMKLGWSEYESKTYAALVKEGLSTASHIAKNSSVPSNKVYQILDRLSSNGFVNKIQGKGSPTLYVAKPPEEVLSIVKKDFESLVEEAQIALGEIQERQRWREFPHAFTITSRGELTAQLKLLIDRADEEIVLMLDTLSELNNGRLIQLLINKFQEGVKILIITAIQGINDPYEIEVFHKLNPLEIRIADGKFSHITLVVDGTVSLLATYALNSPAGLEKSFVGLLVEDQTFAKLLRKTIVYEWKEATPALRN